MMSKDQNEEYVVLVVAQGEIEAQVLRSILESEGIVVAYTSTIAQNVYPISVDGLGEITLHVPAEDRERAEEIIREYRKRAEAAGDSIENWQIVEAPKEGESPEN
jgi:hypothetical protein